MSTSQPARRRIPFTALFRWPLVLPPAPAFDRLRAW